MKIAYLCADMGIPVRGHKGASVHVREMVSALTAQGHDVKVFTPSPGSGNPVAAPIHVVEPQELSDQVAGLIRRATRHPRAARETGELFYNVELYRRTREACRLWRPDAIYERYSLFNLAGLALARRWGIPHVLEVNAPLRIERARTRGLALEPVARVVERGVFANSDAVFVVSAALQNYVLSHGGRASHTRVLPNGVDTSRFRPDASGAAVRARLGLRPDALVIGFAGSLKEWHGVDALVDAFATVRRSLDRARLLVIGEGPGEGSLHAQVRRLAIDESVIFAGKAPHADMPGLVAALDLAVAPYLAVPGFYFSPLKIYEYMAAGRAIVASAVGEIPLLLQSGRAGVLVPAGDVAHLAGAIAGLAADPDWRSRLGENARAAVLQHSWERNALVVADAAGAWSRKR
jgi:glycosyltransferase involved in cell wall biosynthesis